MTVSTSIIRRKRKQNITNKYTNWDTFRDKMDSLINLQTSLKTIEELEQQTNNFVSIIREAAWDATPTPGETPDKETCYPTEIRNMIKDRRKARRIWHRTRHPVDKTTFNRISNKLNQLIKKHKEENFEEYLMNLSPEAEKDYSLWKAMRRFKRPNMHVPPIKKANGSWARRDEEKAELFAQHLASVFQPHDIQSNINPIKIYQDERTIKWVTPMEIAREIDTNINPKKAPGIDEISPGILKELSRKAVIMLTYLFNGCFRLKYVPESFKTAQIIMLKKPDKPAEEVTSYRPISLLPATSKLFEKLLLKRLKPVINIPDFQFGFREKHSTVDQVHRITTVIEQALEERKYCPAVFIDVSQAFDRVWHEGLIHKMSKLLPSNFCQLLESYISERTFRVKHEEACSNFYPIKAGVPQGSVLGPLLYVLYTADIPTTTGTTIGTFADDTVIMAKSESQDEAVEHLQRALDKVTQWTRDWKIKLNEQKSIQVTFTLRRKNTQLYTHLNGIKVPQAESAKYLGLHLDSRLNWKHHVRQKALQVSHKLREMYWVVGRQSKLNLYCKRLIYQTIIKPIWTYGIQLWGCTKPSNRLVIQRSQNKFLRVITNAYRYVTNEEIHQDLSIKLINEVIQEYAINHEKRMHEHVNVEVLQLLDHAQDIRRLRRVKPYELVTEVIM